MVTMSIIPAESIGAIEKQKEANIGLLREMIVNGRRLSDEQITGRAAFAALYGLNPVDEVNTITNAQGQTMAHSMHINGFRRKCDEQVNRELPGAKVMLEFVEFEKEKLPGGAAYAFECRLRDGSSQDAWARNMTKIGKQLREILGPNLSYKDLVEAVGPSPIYSGVGIVYTRELNDYKDQNFNPIERAKKRAERNARGRRFTINAPIYDGEPSVLIDQDAIEGEFKDHDDGAAEVGRKSFKRPENVALTDLGFPPAGYTREDYDKELKEAEAQVGPPVEVEKVEPPVSASEVDETDGAPDGFIDGEGIELTLKELWPADASMSFEMASTLTNKIKDGDPVRYVDMTADQLGKIVEGLNTRLADRSKLSEKQIDDYSLRLDALRIIRMLK